MAFLDSMKGKLSQASQTTVQKAKELSEIAKLNSAVSEAENQITELYSKIGYEVYCAYKDNPIPEVAEFINQITELHESIEVCKEQIKTINAANLCQKCGAKIKPGMLFCSACGYKLPVPEMEETSGEATFCSGCGAALVPGSAFCTSCGKKVE